ncbi:OmpA family protein [Pseudogemmobacter bohemicus]|uniref:OmpA family protein n=1 Tax=Pseudogemmobacter bohemicus TaxID=2250708 RepID=UPI001E5AE5E9|nr:OmpA family protein [Pseudogemmobacter bohemicus]
MFSRAARMMGAGLVPAATALAIAISGGTAALSQSTIDRRVVTGQIEWGVWVDDDGCMHWWADGGLEGYMVPRRDPKTGMPVCLKKNLCLTENTDQLFATDSANLTKAGRQRLAQFFSSTDAFGYAIYGHTDSRASDEYNMSLSQRRAKAVADVARSVGASVEREIGFGERNPIASNASAGGMAKNRRVEIVCYRW